MLKEYLVVAQEALEAKKEMYLVKQQRLELAQQEMLLFHELSEDNRSIASSEWPLPPPLSVALQISGRQNNEEKPSQPPRPPFHPAPLPRPVCPKGDTRSEPFDEYLL